MASDLDALQQRMFALRQLEDEKLWMVEQPEKPATPERLPWPLWAKGILIFVIALVLLLCMVLLHEEGHVSIATYFGCTNNTMVMGNLHTNYFMAVLSDCGMLSDTQRGLEIAAQGMDDALTYNITVWLWVGVVLFISKRIMEDD